MSSAPTCSRSAPKKNCRSSVAAFALATAALLSGCSSHSGGSQDAARGKNFEVSTSELDEMLANVSPAAITDPKLRQAVLDQVIDQKLLSNQAKSEGLDRDPDVVEALEATRRQILASAYVKRLTAPLPPPKPSEVDSYYDSHPALFADRKIFTLRELNIVGAPDQVTRYKSLFAAHSSLEDVQSAMQAAGVNASILTAGVAPDTLPPQMVVESQKMKIGDTLIFNLGQGDVFAILQRIDDAPITREQAQGAIVAALKKEQAQTLVERQLSSLRQQADVHYVKPAVNGAVQ